MTTKSRNTPLTRLSRIGLVLGIGSTQVTGNGNSQGGDDSYIPYNGPYEPPTTSHEIHGYWDSGEDTILDARSFSHLSTNGGKTHGSISTSRRYSDASKLTLSNVMTEPRRRFGRVRQNSTPMLGTYVNLDQGGIGDTPVPVHRSTSTKVSSQRPSVGPPTHTFHSSVATRFFAHKSQIFVKASPKAAIGTERPTAPSLLSTIAFLVPQHPRMFTGLPLITRSQIVLQYSSPTRLLLPHRGKHPFRVKKVVMQSPLKRRFPHTSSLRLTLLC